MDVGWFGLPCFPLTHSKESPQRAPTLSSDAEARPYKPDGADIETYTRLTTILAQLHLFLDSYLNFTFSSHHRLRFTSRSERKAATRGGRYSSKEAGTAPRTPPDTALSLGPRREEKPADAVQTSGKGHMNTAKDTRLLYSSILE